jgi:2-dehydropantoate 2-reductase
MRIAVVGAGAVGGFYGAKLARAGHDVVLLARGAHLRAIRERGLVVWSPLGDFTVRAAAEEDPARIGVVDLVLFAVKTYDNASVLPRLQPLVGPSTIVLTLQNGVDSIQDVSSAVGEQAVLGGATYIATALTLPGLVEQTGTHRRIVFGEVFGNLGNEPTPRVRTVAETFASADIQAEPVADARVPLWEKFVYLSPFAAFTGAARLPIGPLWSDPGIREAILNAVDEVARVAEGEGIRLGAGLRENIIKYIDALPPSTRSSLLIDLQAGKRIEVEALQGSVDRRGRRCGVPTPIVSALYAVLKPHAEGRRG